MSLDKIMSGEARKLASQGELNWTDYAKPVLAPVAAVGNFLDLPGSMVRDVISGVATGNWNKNNPFDQLLSPLSGENRASGADNLYDLGLMRKNKETGLVPFEDPGEFARDIGRFGFEMLADPLSWLALGPLTKAGTAAAKQGSLTKGLSASLQSGERSLFGLRNPFPFSKQEPFAHFGSGPMAQKAASAVESGVAAAAKTTVGSGAAKVGRELSRMFSPSVMGAGTREGQRIARDVYDARKRAASGAMSETLKYSRNKRLDLSDPDDIAQVSASLKEHLENTAAFRDADLDQIATGMADAMAKARNAAGDLGVDVSDDLDDIIGFAPRYITEQFGQRAKGWASTADPKDTGRQWYMKGFRRGTKGVNELVTDPQLKSIIENQINTDWNTYVNSGNAGWADVFDKDAAVNRVATEIESRYANDVDRYAYTYTVDGKEMWDFKNSHPSINPSNVFANNTGADSVTLKGQPIFVKQGGGWVRKGNKTGDVTVTRHDRYKAIAEKMIDNPEILERGLFNNHVVADFHNYLARMNDRAAVAEQLHKGIASLPTSKLRRVTTGDARGVSLKEVYETLGLDVDKSMDLYMQAKGWNPASVVQPPQKFDASKLASQLYIDDDIAKDLLDLWPAFKAPSEVHGITKLADTFNSWFKAGVLTAPARYVRDVVSGAVRNAEAGMFDLGSAKDSWFLLSGDSPAGMASRYGNIPAVQDKIRTLGLNAADDADVAEALRQLYGEHRGLSGSLYTEGMEEIPAQNIRDLHENIPGSSGRLTKEMLDAAKSGSWKPWEVRGSYSPKAGDYRRTSEFKPVKVGDAVGQWTDDMNRLTPFLNRLKKGYSPEVAMDYINKAQVDYSPRAFTATERKILKRIFPFYSFTSRQVPWVVKNLMMNPGGRLGWMLRASSKSQDEQQPAPEYVRKTLSIPLGESSDGGRKYLTGLGLMHEDPISFLAEGAGYETLSRLNPLIKGPIEAYTGQSFFQGGRDLRDLDPAMGRLISNVTGKEDPVRLPLALETLASNSPLSRMITSARVLTDPRRGLAEKALNLGTGFRTTIVSPGVQDAVVREAVDERMRELGAKSFNVVSFNKQQQGKMADEERQLAEALQQIRNRLSKNAQDRARKKDDRASRLFRSLLE